MATHRPLDGKKSVAIEKRHLNPSDIIVGRSGEAQSIACNEKPPREKEGRKQKVPVLRQHTFLWNCSRPHSCASLHKVLQQEIV